MAKKKRADRKRQLIRQKAKRDRKRREKATRNRETSLPSARDANQQPTAPFKPTADDLTLFSLLQAATMELTADALLKDHPKVGVILKKSDRVETAAVYGAMLLDPRLQSNCTRLEALVHLAVATCEGVGLVTQSELAECFNALGGGVAGMMEDPAEDVFVSLVTTPEGNFRVLEGIWESGTFYLQQVLDIIETMPVDGVFAKLRRAVLALLKLSEAVCGRAGLVRYTVGEASPRSKVQPAFCSKKRREIIFFDRDQLAELGVTKEDLDVFILDDQLLSEIGPEPIANSPLQRFPILDDGNRLALVLPSAVSIAIRTTLVDFVIAQQHYPAFRKNLQKHYTNLLQSTRLLGSFVGTPIWFVDDGDLPIAEVIATADSGRYFHFIFVAETLDYFMDTGLVGIDPGPAKHIGLIETRIQKGIEHATGKASFREGVTLLVHCGIGRGVAQLIPETGRDNWNVEAISVADLYTLSSDKTFNALKLWRALEGSRRMSELGVEIHNMNGLLNLIAWIDSNDGLLIPHLQAPKGFRSGGGRLLLHPDWVLKLRRRVAEENDVHRVPTVLGETAVVRRVTGSFFPEDNALPIYAIDDYSPETGHPLVYVSDQRYWWCHVVPSAEGVGDYDRWLMMKTWLPRIVRALEPTFDSLNDVVLLHVEFQRVDPGCYDVPLPTRSEIDDGLICTVDVEQSTVGITAGKAFELGLAHTTNVSERALVAAACQGFARLADVKLSPDEVHQLESRIIPNDDARQLHVFHTRTFRDRVRNGLGIDVVKIDDRDIADLHAGLAFRVESRDAGRSSLRSKQQCTNLLNSIVRHLEDEICADLKQFNLASFVAMCLRNHEVATIQRDRWTRTARANLAIHKDCESTLAVIANHEMHLLSVLFPSRVLIEFAQCECAVSGGTQAGQLDLSRLMAKVNLIWEFGGWSDAIHLDAMPPNLTITALGDVHAVTEFTSSVLAPFAEKAIQMRIGSAVEEYEENFRPPEVREQALQRIDSRFKDAWNEEFGFTISDVRAFLDAVEDVGTARDRPVFQLPRSELLSELSSTLRQEILQPILDAFTLQPRETWQTIPKECHEQDIQAWRFRRQLSTIRRPILQLDLSDDPQLVIAPGPIREGIAHVFHEYYEGSYPLRHYRSKRMRSWCGTRYKERGSAFAVEVAAKVRELGWQVKFEANVTELLGGSSDADFGDLSGFGDVDVLAWSEVAGRMLVIECKHLQYQKTAGEIVRQLADYRGLTKSDGKPDDLLKHLNRLELLNARKQTLCNRVGVKDSTNLEGWVLFKNPVPMLYVWREFEEQLRVATFNELENVLRGR